MRTGSIVGILIAVLVIAASPATGNYLVNEDFEGPVFPPPGWQAEFADWTDVNSFSPVHSVHLNPNSTLTTPLLNGPQDLYFRFWVSEDNPALDIFISEDGSDWIFHSRRGTSPESWFGAGPIDISALPSPLYLQFRLDPWAEAPDHIFIDDIQVTTSRSLIPQTWYLPSGAAWSVNGHEVETFILVANPTDNDVEITVRFVGEGGLISEHSGITVAATSRRTLKMSDYGIDQEGPVSTIVFVDGVGPVGIAGSSADHPIFCERATYVTTGGARWALSDGSIGSPELDTTWYFAEGATHLFDFAIVLLNPGEEEAAVQVTFTGQGGMTEWANFTIPAGSNYDLWVNDIFPGQSGISTLIESDQPIAVERDMIWPWGEEESEMFRGPGDLHASIGLPGLFEEWIFAEGATHIFDYYIALANFSAETANVEVIFSDPNGVIPLTEANRVIAPGGRATVKVNNYVGSRGQVAVRVVSDQPVYAERSMYWNGAPGFWKGGQSSVGVPVAALSNVWVVVEGATHVFDHYITVFNPGDEAVDVVMSFMGKAGALADPEYTVGPKGRLTVKVNDVVGSVDQVSTMVTASGPVVVDRAMYYGGRPGDWRTGHSSLAFPVVEPVIEREWHGPEHLAGHGEEKCCRPELAIDPQGNVIVVFKKRYDSNNADMYAVRYDAASGEWGEPVLISDDTEDTIECNQSVAMDEAGNAVAVWVMHVSGWHPSVYANRYDAVTGQWLEEPELIAQGVAEEMTFCAPDVAVDPEGNAVCVFKARTWWEHPEFSWISGYYLGKIHARRFDAASSTWGDAVLLSTPDSMVDGYYYEACRPAVGMDAEGNAICSFVQSAGVDPFYMVEKEVFANRYDAATDSWEGMTRVSPEIGGGIDKYCHSESAVSRNGDAVVVFLEDGSGGRVMAARYDGTAGAWTAPEVISDYDACRPRVAINDSGAAACAFVFDQETVMMSLYRPATGEWSPPMMVSTDACHAEVAIDGFGNVFVGYQVDNQEVWAFRYSEAEGTWSQTLISDPEVYCCRPRVAAAANGCAALAYVYDANSSDAEVHAAVYR